MNTDSIVLYKLIILYMLDRVDFTLTNSQISDFVLTKGYTNYFTLQEAINGLIECDTPHIIKGRIVKVKNTEREEQFDQRGNHIGAEVHEVISNKMIFNVLTPNGFKALT